MKKDIRQMIKDALPHTLYEGRTSLERAIGNVWDSILAESVSLGDVPFRSDFYVYGWLKDALSVDDSDIIEYLASETGMEPILETGEPVFEYTMLGRPDYFDMISLLAGRPVFMVGEEGMLKLSREHNFKPDKPGDYKDEVRLHVYHPDPSFVMRISEKFFRKFLRPVRATVDDVHRRGVVHMLMASPQGFRLEEVGDIGWKLDHGNYSRKQMDSFRKISRSLRSDSPSGSLSILSGVPGTGKTYFIRGLVEDNPGCMWVVMPSSMLSQLTNPSLIRAFVSHKEASRNPLVLIIEDADECLVPRQADNMSSISTLLNLGDGLLGEVLNLRVIASTNAQRVDIDDALKRPGRLCENLDFPKLDARHASAIYERLTGRSANYTTPVELARVYEDAAPHIVEEELPEVATPNLSGYGTLRARMQEAALQEDISDESFREKVKRTKRMKGW